MNAAEVGVEEYNRNAMLLENKEIVAKYENVETDTCLEYKIVPNGVKEDIVVQSPQEQYRYSFLLNTGGLMPVSDNANTIRLVDNQQKTVYTLEAPVMTDSAGAESTAIQLDVQESADNQYILTVDADSCWLNAPDRQFPVAIDPTVRLNFQASNIHDAYVDSQSPNTHLNNDYAVYVGNNGLGLTRTYIKFNLPELPKYSKIVGACFAMFVLDCDVPDSNTGKAVMNLYDLSSFANWDYSNITWNNQPVPNSKNGINGSTAVVDYCDFSNATVGTGCQWDITSMVKKWYEGGTNKGLMISSSDEFTAPLRMRFFSVQSGSVDEVYPGLWVSYRDTRGLEGYWSFSSYSAGDAGTVYINDSTGNMVLVRNDTGTYGQRMPVTLSHVFNASMAGVDSGYAPAVGQGWQLSV